MIVVASACGSAQTGSVESARTFIDSVPNTDDAQPDPPSAADVDGSGDQASADSSQSSAPSASTTSAPSASTTSVPFPVPEPIDFLTDAVRASGQFPENVFAGEPSEYIDIGVAALYGDGGLVGYYAFEYGGTGWELGAALGDAKAACEWIDQLGVSFLDGFADKTGCVRTELSPTVNSGEEQAPEDGDQPTIEDGILPASDDEFDAFCRSASWKALVEEAVGLGIEIAYEND
jgi:hypothetical protein